MKIKKYPTCGYYALCRDFTTTRELQARTYCGRLSCRYNSLYSYNTMVAKLDFENKIVFVTAEKYSCTTSRQIKILRNYLYGWIELPMIESNQINQYFVNEIEEYSGKLRRARKTKHIHIYTLEALLNQVLNYIKLLDIEYYEYLKDNIDVDELHKLIFATSLLIKQYEE